MSDANANPASDLQATGAEAPAAEASAPILDPANPPKGSDPAEVAATMFDLYKRRADLMITALSGKGAKRVLERLLMYPIEREWRWTDMKEKETFLVLCAMSDAKFVMMMSTYMENLSQILASGGTPGEDANNSVPSEGNSNNVGQE